MFGLGVVVAKGRVGSWLKGGLGVVVAKGRVVWWLKGGLGGG